MVYLIHLDQEFKGKRHYIGLAVTAETYLRRIQHHRKGTGSAFLRAVNRAGISWNVVREWPDEDGKFERKLKGRKKARVFCPLCNKKLSHVHASNTQLPS